MSGKKRVFRRWLNAFLAYFPPLYFLYPFFAQPLIFASSFPCQDQHLSPNLAIPLNLLNASLSSRQGETDPAKCRACAPPAPRSPCRHFCSTSGGSGWSRWCRAFPRTPGGCCPKAGPPSLLRASSTSDISDALFPTFWNLLRKIDISYLRISCFFLRHHFSFIHLIFT